MKWCSPKPRVRARARRRNLDALPARSGVFILRGDQGAEPYVAKSANLKQRLQRLLGPAEEGSKKLNLRQQTRTIEYSITGSDFENRFLLYRTLRAIFPTITATA